MGVKVEPMRETEEVRDRRNMTIVQVLEHMIEKFRTIPDESVKGIILDIVWDNQGDMVTSGVTQGSFDILMACRASIDQRLTERLLRSTMEHTLN